MFLVGDRDGCDPVEAPLVNIQTAIAALDYSTPAPQARIGDVGRHAPSQVHRWHDLLCALVLLFWLRASCSRNGL